MKKLVFSVFSAGILVAAASVWAEPFCGAMTKEKAAVILACPVSEIEFRSSEELHSCGFSKDLWHSINYSLYSYNFV